MAFRGVDGEYLLITEKSLAVTSIVLPYKLSKISLIPRFEFEFCNFHGGKGEMSFTGIPARSHKGRDLSYISHGLVLERNHPYMSSTG